MPEQDKGRRASGGWVDPDAVPVYYYGPDQLGGLCAGCKMPVPAAIGDDRHSTCDPDWPDLVKHSKRAARRKTPPKETLR